MSPCDENGVRDVPVFNPLPTLPSVDQLPLAAWVGDDWSVLPWEREPVEIGYNSHTWKVDSGGVLSVLKAVPLEHADRFEVGLSVATTAASHGVPSGAPRPTADGALVARSGDWCWALLEFLDGQRIDTTDAAQLHEVGAVLGRVHTALRDMPRPEHVMAWDEMDWLLADADFLEPHPWIQRAVAESMAELPHDLVTGVIHGDPRVTEFRTDGAVVGLLDWGEVMYAPHVFDVATVLSYLDAGTDTEPLLRGYLSESVIGAAELTHVDTVRKFRYAAEAWIYARRESFGITLGQEGSHHTNLSILEMKRDDIAAIDSGESRTLIP
jgi:Ser/Thr protein kinase RdoA (MazF antagonist)